MDITIDVTMDNINDGICGDRRKCAVAQALVDQGWEDVEVHSWNLYVRSSSGATYFGRHSDELKQFISDFDNPRREAFPSSYLVSLQPRWI